MSILGFRGMDETGWIKGENWVGIGIVHTKAEPFDLHYDCDAMGGWYRDRPEHLKSILTDEPVSLERIQRMYSKHELEQLNNHRNRNKENHYLVIWQGAMVSFWIMGMKGLENEQSIMFTNNDDAGKSAIAFSKCIGRLRSFLICGSMNLDLVVDKKDRGEAPCMNWFNFLGKNFDHSTTTSFRLS